MLKKTIGMVLLLLVLGISVYSHLNSNGEMVEDMEKETEETNEFYEGEEFGHHDGGSVSENQSEISVYEIRNIELVYDYLDPADTSYYEDLITIYASFLPLCASDNPEEFYEANKDKVADVLGIYSYDGYLALNNRLNAEGIEDKSLIDGVEMLSIKESRGLLEADMRFYFGEATLDMSHRLDYVYFGSEPYLFMYSVGGES